MDVPPAAYAIQLAPYFAAPLEHNRERACVPKAIRLRFMSFKPRPATASSGKAPLPTGNTTFVAAVFQKMSPAASSHPPRPAAETTSHSAAPPPAQTPPVESDDLNVLIRSGGSTPRSPANSSGRVLSIDRNIFNVEDAVGGSFDRPKANMIIKGTFKELQELREKIRAEFQVASIDDVGDIEIFDEENNSWNHLVSFDLADRLSRKSIAKLRWCVSRREVNSSSFM